MTRVRLFTKKRWKLVALAVTAAAVGGIAAQVVAGGGNKVRIGSGSVSALARVARSGDALPASVLALPFADRNFASPTGAGSRRLATDGALTLYAVPGKARLLCLVEVESVARTAGGACADRTVLLTGSIYMADVRDDGTKDVVGFVGDGHTYAEAEGRRVPVRGNAFVLRGAEGNHVKLGSPTGTQTIEIGE